MSKVAFTIVVKETDIKVRKQQPQTTRVFRNKKKYSRKEKHKRDVGYAHIPLMSSLFFTIINNCQSLLFKYILQL